MKLEEKRQEKKRERSVMRRRWKGAQERRNETYRKGERRDKGQDQYPSDSPHTHQNLKVA